jgi:hypothetical protein
LVKKYAGKVAGKRPPGRIRTMQTRRQPNDEQSRMWVTESRDRCIVVIGMTFSQDRAVRREARTK